MTALERSVAKPPLWVKLTCLAAFSVESLQTHVRVTLNVQMPHKRLIVVWRQRAQLF